MYFNVDSLILLSGYQELVNTSNANETANGCVWDFIRSLASLRWEFSFLDLRISHRELDWLMSWRHLEIFQYAKWLITAHYW